MLTLTNIAFYKWDSNGYYVVYEDSRNPICNDIVN